jgi:hypothetical protein
MRIASATAGCQVPGAISCARPDIGQPQPFGTQDFHLLQAGAQRGRHLHHAGIGGAGIGIDLFKKVDLAGKGRIRHRVVGAVEMAVGARRRGGHHAAARADGQPRRLGRAAQRGFRDFGGMGIARDLALHRAQAETFGGVIAGRADAAIVEDKAFAMAPLEIEFAVFAAGGGRAQHGQGCGLVQMGVEGAEGRVCHLRPSLRKCGNLSIPQT